MGRDMTQPTPPEPVAWMYTPTDMIRLYDGPFAQTNRANMDPRYWTETPLYTEPTSSSADLIEQQAREIARLREDAARYRWLRDHSCPPHNFYISVPDEFHGVRYTPGDVDAYIDAAKAALEKSNVE